MDRRFQWFSACWTKQPFGPPHGDPVNARPEVTTFRGPSQQDQFTPLQPHPRSPRLPGIGVGPDENLAAHCVSREERGIGPLWVPGCAILGIFRPRLRLVPSPEHDLARSVPRGSPARLVHPQT